MNSHSVNTNFVTIWLVTRTALSFVSYHLCIKEGFLVTDLSLMSSVLKYKFNVKYQLGTKIMF
jgi:hypothetical protein